MFVHLLDHTGQAVAGANACLLEHAYCAYEWMPGETIITGTAVGILASSSGAYSSDPGMYSLFESERIPTVDAANLVNGGRILLGLVRWLREAVEPPA